MRYTVVLLGLMLGLGACESDAGGDAGGTTPATPVEVTVGADEAAIVGSLLTSGREPLANLSVLACGDFDCRYAQTDDAGIFVHAPLDLVPRRVEVIGLYDQYGTIVFRREPGAGEVVDVGPLVVPATVGPAAPLDPTAGGTVVLADGALELDLPPGAASYPLGTIDFKLQAAPVPVDAIPPYTQRLWEGVDGVLAYALVPFEIHATSPVAARVTSGVTRPVGTVYRVYHVDTFDGRLEAAGTATVGADGVLATDPDADLRHITFFMFVPAEG